ncbi:MAG: V-type ATP synthase subunit E, partial [Spirochaetales bacterium]|nr:V-type ATP synthase subunit E [Spirochaetales bacterium]MCF7939913.1 V-type ATP synthase subunit E [Spirochaetales bacterium]
ETRRKAKEDAEQMEQSGRAALEQAGRDLLLSLRDRIQNVFESIILSEVRETMDTEVLGRAILALVSSWDTADAENLEVVLSETDRDSLEKMLRAKLSEAMKAGMTISTSKRVKAGFQVGYKDGSAYYDISDQGLAELLSEHLNPRLAESIQKAAKKE